MDADRDDVLEWLHTAHVEGRLDREELTDRAGAVLRAGTVGQLAALTADLPPGSAPGTGDPATAPTPASRTPVGAPDTRPGWPVVLRWGLTGWAVMFTVSTTGWVLSRLGDSRGALGAGWLLFWVILLIRRHRRIRRERSPARGPAQRW